MIEINVNVSGKVGTGKSHVLAVIERALIEAYGETIEIVCDETEGERRSIGADIREWQQPSVERIVLTERTHWHTEEIEDSRAVTLIDGLTDFNKPDPDPTPLDLTELIKQSDGRYPPFKPRYETLDGRIIRMDDGHPTAAKEAAASLVSTANLLHVETQFPDEPNQLVALGYYNDPEAALKHASLVKGMSFDMAIVEKHSPILEKVTVYSKVEIQGATSWDQDGRLVATLTFKIGRMLTRLRETKGSSRNQLTMPLGVTDQG
ncbi:hypothetical protein D3C85_223650 [compost metagenome]